ncbi:MAG: FKBP-type peptidyl-prolyl cis-trans isomerase [Methanocellales archaeon]
MTIQKGDFIKLSYTGKLPDNRVFDTTNENVAREHNIYNKNTTYGPVVVIVGAGHVLPGLDEDLVGKPVGYQGNVTFGPEKGVGPKKLELIETIPVKKLGIKPQIGQRVTVGNKTGVVENIVGGRARVNFNHPLAGETLIYEYKIEERLVSAEEKIKGLIQAFTGLKLEVKVEGENATIIVPFEVSLNSRLLLSKMQLANEILNRTELKSISFLETYKKPEPVKVEEKVPQVEEKKESTS